MDRRDKLTLAIRTRTLQPHDLPLDMKLFFFNMVVLVSCLLLLNFKLISIAPLIAAIVFSHFFYLFLSIKNRLKYGWKWEVPESINLVFSVLLFLVVFGIWLFQGDIVSEMPTGKKIVTVVSLFDSVLYVLLFLLNVVEFHESDFTKRCVVRNKSNNNMSLFNQQPPVTTYCPTCKNKKTNIKYGKYRCNHCGAKFVYSASGSKLL